jgi:phytol kinase
MLPLALWGIPHADPVSLVLKSIVLAIVIVLSIVVYFHFDAIARAGNMRERIGAILGYTGSIGATMLIFPAHLEFAMTVLAVLAFGDGSATLGGLLIGGPKLPWNARKSWAGFVCFILFGSVAASVIYWGEPHFNPEALGSPVAFGTAVICGGSAAVASAVAESIPSRVSDNIRVGVTAAVTVAIAHGLTVGF